MGFFRAIDKLANAGRGSRMPDKLLTVSKGAATTTNVKNDLAYIAANPGASRVARAQARRQLAAEVGSEKEAARLIKQVENKVRTSFRQANFGS